MITLNARRLLPLLLAVAFVACDDGVPTVPTGPRDGGRRNDAGADAGDADASVDPDGGLDAGAPGDAAMPDGGPSGPGCTFSLTEPVVRATTFVSSSDPPALAVRNDGALVSWVALVDGQSRVSVLGIAPDGMARVSGVADEASEQRDPVITAHDAGYVVVWRDARDGDNELLARAVAPDGSASETLRVLTDNDEDDNRPALGVTGSGAVMVAWPGSGASPGHALALGEDAAPGETFDLPAFTGVRGAPALSALPTGAALAWVDEASGGVRVLQLGNDGQPVGAPAEISAEGDATGVLDAARQGAGAVVMYDVNVGGADPQVRYQVLDNAADAVGPEQVLTPASRVGRGGSLATLSTGFAALYRSRADGIDDTILHLTLFEPGAAALNSADVDGLSSLGGSRPIVRSAPDGLRLAAAWTDDGRVLTMRGTCE